jgi:hypothetical protein
MALPHVLLRLVPISEEEPFPSRPSGRGKSAKLKVYVNLTHPVEGSRRHLLCHVLILVRLVDLIVNCVLLSSDPMTFMFMSLHLHLPRNGR